MVAAANGAAVTLRLPLGLLIIYALAVIVWYELVRFAFRSQLSKRKGGTTGHGEAEQRRREEARSTEEQLRAAEVEARAALEADPARRHYYLARKAAKTERDAAVEAANAAAGEAVERIERRCREIEEALVEEESERLNQRRPPPHS